MQIYARSKASRPASSRHFELLQHKVELVPIKKKKLFPIRRRKHKKIIQEKRRTEERKTTQKEKNTHISITLFYMTTMQQKFPSTKTFLQAKTIPKPIFPFTIIYSQKQNKINSKTFPPSFPFSKTYSLFLVHLRNYTSF